MNTEPQKPRHRWAGADYPHTYDVDLDLIHDDECSGCHPAAPVAQEPPAPTGSYVLMQQGITPDGCLCTMVLPPIREWPGPQPAEWEQADDCPVHPLAVENKQFQADIDYWVRRPRQTEGVTVAQTGGQQLPLLPESAYGPDSVPLPRPAPQSVARAMRHMTHLSDDVGVLNGNCADCRQIIREANPPAPGSAQEPAAIQCQSCGAQEQHWSPTHRMAGGAQEPADPPWLTDAIAAVTDDWDFTDEDAGIVLRAALPILRAGIEAEYHAKLVREIGRMP